MILPCLFFVLLILPHELPVLLELTLFKIRLCFIV